MAKKKSPKRRTKPGTPTAAPAVRAVPAVRAAPVAQAEEGKPQAPAFWFGFEVSWAKLVTTRFVLFGVLALDALLTVRRAPRYGANDFNVANLGFLDAFGPGRVSYGVSQLLISLLLTAAALGVATRVVVPVATVLYAWLYFGSQLDSYQHHYMIALVLAVACFAPWQARTQVVRSWALRLLLVEVGIVYLWAAISKLDPVWLDGSALGTQISGRLRSLIEGTVGFQAVAIQVVVIELVLAFTVWVRPAWKYVAPLGIAFHLGIIATGFEIGLFAYDMCALYILVVPDRIWRGAAALELAKSLGALCRRIVEGPWLVAAASVAVVGLPLAYVCRFPHTFTVALVAFGVMLAARVLARTTRQRPTAAVPIAVLVGLMLWTAVDRATTVAIDYYRFWGGSQRRVGDREQAEQAYRGMLAIEPHSEIAHFYLGRILIQTGRDPEGLEHLHDAQLEPRRARAHVEEARYLMGQGKQAEAIAKAKDGVFAEPSDAEARAVLEMLQGGKPAKPSKASPDDAEDQ